MARRYEDRWSRFAANIHYHRGGYDSGADFTALRQKLETLTAGKSLVEPEEKKAPEKK